MKHSKKKHEIVESMAAAAARLKVERHVIRAAKQAGCRAFLPGNRINVIVLGKYLEALAKTSRPAKQSLAPLTSAELAELGSIEQSLEAAKRDEIETGRMLQRARETGDSGAVADLTSAVGRARKNRMVAETSVTKLKLERGQLLTLDEHKFAMYRMWPPLVMTVRQIPRKVALQLGGDEGIRAEKIAIVQVEEALAYCQRTLGKEAEGEAIPILVSLNLDEDPTGEVLLARIDASRALVLAEIAKRIAKSPSQKITPVLPLKTGDEKSGAE